MKKPLALSLIIPAYNEEKHLVACLDSVAAQTVRPAEVIVVDNNSIDRTVEIAQNYSFVRLITEKKQGVVYAGAAGYNAAKHELIGRIDSDTILPSNWVESITAFYTEPKNMDAIFTGSGTYYNTPFPHISAVAFDILAFRVNRIALGHHFSYGSNMAMPKKIWQAIKDDVCMRTDIHDDVDISVHAHRAGYKVRYVPKVQVKTELRRVFQDQSKLWGVLMLWPKTMKVHNNWTWPLGFWGALQIFILTPIIYPVEWLHELRLKLTKPKN